MRKRFEQQLTLCTVAINEVKINPKTRHELAPVLIGLQYLFTDNQVKRKVLKKGRLEKSVKKYLNCCITISEKTGNTLKDENINHTVISTLYMFELERFKQLLDKHIDLVQREILKGEKIPHKEDMWLWV